MLQDGTLTISDGALHHLQNVEASAEWQWAMTMLGGLKERERRYVLRYVQKRGSANQARTAAQGGPSSSATANVSDDDGPP